MSEQEVVVKETKLNKIQMISIDSYLLSKRNVKLHHLKAMKAYAKGRQFATREEWDNIFATY